MNPSDPEVSTKTADAYHAALPRPSLFHRDGFRGLMLILAVLVVYQPALNAGFIWDDDVILTANPVMFDPLGLVKIWTTSAADICPLTKTTFWIEHALWGLAPLPYHLVNILLHGACAVALWRVLRSLRAPGAWLGAALWALHPVQVESVAWISEMKNTESGLFFLLSILFFVKWLRAKDPEGKDGGGWNYALTLLFAALAMAAKSSTVILPVVLGLCAWWVEGRWHGRHLARLAPVFLMSLAASALSIWTQGRQVRNVAAIDPHFARSWPERLATVGDAVWFYLGKLLWPHPLMTIYPRWQIEAGRWASYLPLLAVMVVLLILWSKRDSWARSWFFVFAYFVTALLPALGLVDNYIFRYALVFDHFQYLAAMGPLALAGAGLARFSDVALARRPWLTSALGAVLLLLAGGLSWQRARVYESSEKLWTDALARNQASWMARNNLGRALAQKGRMDEAMALFQTALEINPTDAQAHNNLGIALFQKGRPDEAMAQFQMALEINPNFADAYNNLGSALGQKGRVDEAMAKFQTALDINPADAQAHYNLGSALFQKGRVDEAIAQFQEAVRLNPNDGNAQRYLAKARAAAMQASPQPTP